MQVVLCSTHHWSWQAPGPDDALVALLSLGSVLAGPAGGPLGAGLPPPPHAAHGARLAPLASLAGLALGEVGGGG